MPMMIFNIWPYANDALSLLSGDANDDLWLANNARDYLLCSSYGAQHPLCYQNGAHDTL